MSFMVGDFKTKEYKTIYDEKELSSAVFDTIQYYHRRNEELLAENKTLLADAKAIADKKLHNEIKSLREDLKMSYGHFSSQKEKDAYIKFVKEHIHDRETSRANGGKVPYLIPNHTGIGTILKVKCQICGEEKDITDTEVW